jgi:hypothetical protein
MIAALAGVSLIAAAAADTLLPGTYTNEEQVEFGREAGAAVLPWVGVEISREADGLHLRTIDAYGQRGAEHQKIGLEAEGEGVRLTMGRCRRLFELSRTGVYENVATSGTCASPAALVAMSGTGLTMELPDGRRLDLLRARMWRCWAAIPKQTGGWWGKRDLLLHDRGGRALLETDEPVPQRFVLRMRNVVFPEPPNQPSIVLYVHAEDPVLAISYAWAEPGARRVGINLRTMQASCSLAE